MPPQPGELLHRRVGAAASTGTAPDAHNVRRAFRQVAAAAAGLDAREWTPRELRHSFVSLLSASGVRIEDIARLVGHSATGVTERVYRHQLHAVLDEGTTAMDDIFPLGDAGIVTQLVTQPDRKIDQDPPRRPGERKR
ncbi:tyrosine-type recombinase/integrase [Pseudonocardia sichuanensis]